jgi:hypothetical protein
MEKGKNDFTYAYKRGFCLFAYTTLHPYTRAEIGEETRTPKLCAPTGRGATLTPTRWPTDRDRRRAILCGGWPTWVGITRRMGTGGGGISRRFFLEPAGALPV